MNQCAETISAALGLPWRSTILSPRRVSALVLSLSSKASMGLPCPMNTAGILSATVAPSHVRPHEVLNRYLVHLEL